MFRCRVENAPLHYKTQAINCKNVLTDIIYALNGVKCQTAIIKCLQHTYISVSVKFIATDRLVKLYFFKRKNKKKLDNIKITC